MKFIIVGGGAAGLMATVRIAELKQNVELFSMVPVKRSHTACAQGGINGALNTKGQNDSTRQHFEDTVLGGDFLANQPPVKAMCDAAPGLIHLLDRMGMMFTRTPEGLLDLRPFGGTKHTRTAFSGASTGQQLLYVLDEQVRRYEEQKLVKKFEQWEFVRLILDDNGECRGIVAQNMYDMRMEAFTADAVILATGTGRIAPKIAGLAEHEGRGVSYCATCDAFFYRGKTAAVLGSGEYALHEVQALLPLAGRVILCTNGEPLTADFPEGVEICTEKLAAVEGEEKVSALRLENGELLPVEGLFVALGVAGSAALARKLGAPVENGRIVVDERMQTGIPGLYAAGDCTGGLLQVCKAVYEGALAATEAIKQIRGKK